MIESRRFAGGVVQPDLDGAILDVGGVTPALVERLGGMTYSQDDVTGLGAKLDALELTDGERAALHAVFDSAGPDEEVEGYAYDAFNVANSYFSLRLGSLATRGIIIVGG